MFLSVASNMHLGRHCIRVTIDVTSVKELEQLDDDARIYKLVGPVLIPQEPEEAKNTVSTRMGYISKELTAAKAKIEKLEKLQKEKRIKLLADQQKFQALVQQVAASSSAS